MIADVFYRQFNSRRESIGEVSVEVEEDADLLAILHAAEKASAKALTRRAGRIGVHEVQTDAGIWSADDGGCLISYSAKSGPKVRPQTRLKTWEELAREDDEEARRG